MSLKWIPVVASIFFIGVLNSSDAQTNDATVIQIATSPLDSSAEPYYAQEMGFFRRVGLSVNVHSSNNGAATSAGVESGTFDVGVGNALPVALAYARGIRFEIISPGAVYSPVAPTTVIMVNKNSPIRTAKDLNGKTIGTIALQSIAQLAPEAWIDAHGGDSKTVRFIELPNSALPAALQVGRVDAIVAIEPSVAAAKPFARILADPYTAITKQGFPINVWFTTSQWAKAHPDIIAKLVLAIRETAHWANDHHRESGIILGKYAKLPPETIAQMVRTQYGDHLQADLIQPNIDLAVKYGLLSQGFDAAALLYPQASR